MKTIGKVLKSMTRDDFVSAAEQNLREADANARLAKLEQAEVDRKALAEKRAADERQWCIEMGHPEYASKKNLERMLKRIGKHPDQIQASDRSARALELRRAKMRGTP